MSSREQHGGPGLQRPRLSCHGRRTVRGPRSGAPSPYHSRCSAVCRTRGHCAGRAGGGDPNTEELSRREPKTPRVADGKSEAQSGQGGNAGQDKALDLNWR